MKRFIIAVLLLIFMSFSIMAENTGNVSFSVSEIKSNNDILLKCSNMAGENAQGTGITENNGNNIFLKCINSETGSENIIGTNKISSQNILLKCLNTSESTEDELTKDVNTAEKLLKCSNIVRIIKIDELSQIESANAVQLKCSNTVTNNIVLKCSGTSENLLKKETTINSGTVNTAEKLLKCSNIVKVIDGNKVFSDNPENNDAVILNCSDMTVAPVNNVVGTVGQSGGSIGGVSPVVPIIGGAVPAVGAIIGATRHHGGGGGGNGTSKPQKGGGENNKFKPQKGGDDNSSPKKQKKEDSKIHNVRGIGIQPVNPFWRSNLREAEDSYSKIARVGFQWVRITASWHRIQSQRNGAYDWQDIDDAVALARKYNLKVLMQISGAPEWATGADKLSAAEKNALNARKIWVASFAPLPQYNNEFSNFVSALVKRYAPKGVIDYEFWNEPGNPEFWHDTIQNPRPNPEHYTDLLKIAYTAAHDAHNDVNVMAGGMTVG
ncbi:hypothetical protein HMPREF3180_00528, partial [Leptotrichia wadei]